MPFGFREREKGGPPDRTAAGRLVSSRNLLLANAIRKRVERSNRITEGTDFLGKQIECQMLLLAEICPRKCPSLKIL